MRLFALIGILFCITTLTYPQSEREIVSKYRTALQKTIDETSIHSMELKGIFTVQKLSFPAVLYYRSPALRVEMSFQTLTFLQISNDSIKWEYNPVDDKNTITRIEKKAGGLPQENSSFDFINYDLLNYKELKHQLKKVSNTRMDSLNVYVLELEKTDKTKSKFFIDTKSNLIYKIEDKKGYRYFANYSNTNGYIFPKYVIESNPDQRLEVRFNELIFNKALADSLFIIPAYAFEKDIEPKKVGDQFMMKGDSLYNSRKYDLAIQHYSKAIKANDQNEYAFNARGLAKIELKEYYEAISDFSKAIEINPTGAHMRNNLGLAKYYLGDHAGAIKDYTKALELDSTYAVSYKNRGLIYLETKKYDLAAKDYSNAIRFKPQDGGAHFKLGIVLAELEKYEEALSAYSLARKNNYRGADIYNYKGVSEYKLEKYDSARTSFKRALGIVPDHLQYIENYGRSLYELSEYEAASEQFETYLKIQPDNASIHNMNGLCKYKDENYKDAIKDFSKSIQFSSKEATYYDNRASAKEMIEDYEGAIQDYGMSIQIYPNDASVFYKRGLIKLNTSKKIEGCLDLATANEMKYEPAKEAILKNCH